MWDVPSAERLYQFRHGTREACIYSLNFNVVSTLLAVSSAHDMVHIFKLGSGRSANNNNTSNTSSSSREDHTTSPSGSVDSREGTRALKGGYNVFVDDKKATITRIVSTLKTAGSVP